MLSWLFSPTAIFLILLGFVAYFLFFRSDSEDDDSDSENEIAEFVDDGRPKLIILYGTQTGTAEDYARVLEGDAQRYGFNAYAKDMMDCEAVDLAEEERVVLVVATYGSGESTDGAKGFYEGLKNVADLDLSKLEYTVFGLGNSQYQLYQAMARFYDKRLEKLGANRVFELGEGDADKLMEEDFEDWKSRFLTFMSQKYNTTISEEKIETKYDLQWMGKKESPPFLIPRGIPDHKMPFLSTITKKEQLLNNCKDRSTVHVEFDILNSNITYEAGDHLAVYAENDKQLVYKYAARLGVKDFLPQTFSMSHKVDRTKGHYFPKKCSLLDVFTFFVDLQSLPRKKFIKGMAWYAEDPKEQEELRLMGGNSQSGKDLYDKVVRQPHLMPIDLLNSYPSVTLPLPLFFELMPHLSPRYYSIASGPGLYPNSIHACCAVVKYPVGKGSIRTGVCSGFLEKIQSSAKAYVYVRHSNFHLPPNPSRPIIMIGPGTGLAPFRGFLQHRRSLLQHGKVLGDAFLYFGCRRKDEDFIYQQELEAAEKDGIISKLSVAFSREQDKKVYVQHLMLQDKEEIFAALEKGGYVYVCGDAKYMAKDVNNALIEIVKASGKSQYDAERYIEKLEPKRYFKDVWSA